MQDTQGISWRTIRSRACSSALVVLLLSSISVAAQEGTPAAAGSLLADLGFPELLITTDGAGFGIPDEVGAGRYRIVLHNNSDLDIDLEFFQLPEGATVDDIAAAYASLIDSDFNEIPDIFFELDFNGGLPVGPGGIGDIVLDLTPGKWVINLFTFNEKTQSDIVAPTTITVTGEMPALEDPPGVVEIGMVDIDFVLPEPIAAGPQIWKVVNIGETGHHLILSQVPDGTTEEQFFTLVSSFSDPSAHPEADATPVMPTLTFEDVVDVFETLAISRGRANWLTVDLAPGTYAAVCFLPDRATGMPHATLGMVEVFTIGA